MWAALLSAQCSVHNGFRHTVHGIDGLETSMLKQAKTSDTKACMPDFDHIAGPVRDPPELGILPPKNEFDEFVSIDPVRPVQDGQAAQHPPAVADIFLLLRPAVLVAAVCLSLAEPARQLLCFDNIQPSHDGEGCEAGKYLARVS